MINMGRAHEEDWRERNSEDCTGVQVRGQKKSCANKAPVGRSKSWNKELVDGGQGSGQIAMDLKRSQTALRTVALLMLLNDILKFNSSIGLMKIYVWIRMDGNH